MREFVARTTAEELVGRTVVAARLDGTVLIVRFDDDSVLSLYANCGCDGAIGPFLYVEPDIHPVDARCVDLISKEECQEWMRRIGE